MRKSDLNVTVEIKSGLQKQLRAWVQTATLSLGEKGFPDSEGFWRAEEEPGILDISRVKEMLQSTFNRAGLLKS